MAKEKKTKEKTKAKKDEKKALTLPLLSPRVTEKSSMLTEGNIYTFNVHRDANKSEVAIAVFASFKVKPVKVNILSIKKKAVKVRGKIGVRGGGRKAVVYLKKGDKIEFV